MVQIFAVWWSLCAVIGDAAADSADTGACRRAVDPAALSADSDGDGLSDQREQCTGLDPYNPDSDGDGRTDGAEVCVAGPPCPRSAAPDTDHTPPIDALDADDDGDGLPSRLEGWWDADHDDRPAAMDTDSDGDGRWDGAERSGLAACQVSWEDLNVPDSDCDGSPDVLDHPVLGGTPEALQPTPAAAQLCGCSGGPSGRTRGWMIAVLWLLVRRAPRAVTLLAAGNTAACGRPAEGEWALSPVSWETDDCVLSPKIVLIEDRLPMSKTDAGFELDTLQGVLRCASTGAQFTCEPLVTSQVDVGEALGPGFGDEAGAADTAGVIPPGLFDDLDALFVQTCRYSGRFLSSRRSLMDVRLDQTCAGLDCEALQAFMELGGVSLVCSATGTLTAERVHR